jgi:hypothetical protein
MRRRIALILASALIIASAAPAAAGKPVMERVNITDIGVRDDFLSEACGFDIWFDVLGHVIIRTFLDANGNPVREVNNFGMRVDTYSEFGSFSSVDVGADRVTFLPDGSLILIPIGNVRSIHVPGQGQVYSHVGFVKLHITFPEEGDPIVELLADPGQHDDNEIDVICEVLGG